MFSPSFAALTATPLLGISSLLIIFECLYCVADPEAINDLG
ncbi:hypothetical Protein YC6258_03934 [Gynuella sunshinyii YC6258]|uniref:Uncharacterized protein n=1 Tax=Gynuella sunshinyii YC6258 TaxID=1445510 RepID=A0A0C5V9C1_9GAMM|nr:hypothetical Protein YC6258_03934 [Gynuella sunshinyii YC6258]